MLLGGECFFAAAATVGSSIPNASKAPDGRLTFKGFSPAINKYLLVRSRELGGRSTVSDREILNSEVRIVSQQKYSTTQATDTEGLRLYHP
ncbi:unnamed protein product [Arctia plantaginis]|uniref:Uncharacterized protein n=1 Tax=Arctia plantaginis TaxID=874455 RepID=A0A8S0YTQ1_ARCPL|nr:unnamed protein product [Arctia plantaginis]